MRLVFLLAVLCGLALAQSGPDFYNQYSGFEFGNGKVALTSKLLGSNEVPKVSSLFVGGGFCLLDRNASPKTLNCMVGSNVSGATITGLHIHLGGPGEEGSVLYNFGCSSCGTIVTANFEIVPAFGLSADEIEREILGGNAYFNLHTTTNPGGELRGQLGQFWQFTTRLSTGEVVQDDDDDFDDDAVIDSTSDGFGLFNVVGGTDIEYLVFHDITDPAEPGGFGVGARGHVGHGLVNIVPSSSNAIQGTATLTPSALVEFYRGNVYFLLRSVSFPRGELRGQINPATPKQPFLTHSAQLRNQDVFTIGAGNAAFSYNCRTHNLEYWIVHNLPHADYVEITGGSNTYGLVNAVSPIVGAITIFQDDVLELIAGSLTLSVQSGGAVVGAGAIAPLSATNTHAAILTSGNSQSVNPKQSATGVLTAQLDTDLLLQGSLQTQLLQEPATIEFTVGVLTGESVRTFPIDKYENPLEFSRYLTTDQATQLLASNMAVTVKNGNGPLSGTLVPLLPSECSYLPFLSEAFDPSDFTAGAITDDDDNVSDDDDDDDGDDDNGQGGNDDDDDFGGVDDGIDGNDDEDDVGGYGYVAASDFSTLLSYFGDDDDNYGIYFDYPPIKVEVDGQTVFEGTGDAASIQHIGLVLLITLALMFVA